MSYILSLKHIRQIESVTRLPEKLINHVSVIVTTCNCHMTALKFDARVNFTSKKI